MAPVPTSLLSGLGRWRSMSVAKIDNGLDWNGSDVAQATAA